MRISDTIIILIFIIVHLELLWEKYRPKFKKYSKHRKEIVIKSLAAKQKEDDLIVEKDKDLTIIDEYIKEIKQFIDNFNKSKNKKIAYRTRQNLLIKTINIIPTLSKHITLNYYYNLDDKEWYKLTDRDMVMLLESAYNDYTHENLDSLNSIITAVLRLRDDKR